MAKSVINMHPGVRRTEQDQSFYTSWMIYPCRLSSGQTRGGNRVVEANQTPNTSQRDKAIADAECRMKLLTDLSNALAEDPSYRDKVLQAREHVLTLQEEIKKLRVSRGPKPKTVLPRRTNLAEARG